MPAEENKRNREHFHVCLETHKINSALVHDIWPFNILTFFFMLIFITFSRRQILSLSACSRWVWSGAQLNGLAKLKEPQPAGLSALPGTPALGVEISRCEHLLAHRFMFHRGKMVCSIPHFWERGPGSNIECWCWQFCPPHACAVCFLGRFTLRVSSSTYFYQSSLRHSWVTA